MFEFDHGRDELIERAGGLAAMAAVLLFGFSIGAMWVGWQVQSTGCVTQVGVTGACTALPAVETWVNRAVGGVVLLFVAAFGAEWHQQQLGGENRGQLVSDGEETHNHD